VLYITRKVFLLETRCNYFFNAWSHLKVTALWVGPPSAKVSVKICRFFIFQVALSKIKNVTTKHTLNYDFISILAYASVKVASGRLVL